MFKKSIGIDITKKEANQQQCKKANMKDNSKPPTLKQKPLGVLQKKEGFFTIKFHQVLFFRYKNMK